MGNNQQSMVYYIAKPASSADEVYSLDFQLVLSSVYDGFIGTIHHSKLRKICIWFSQSERLRWSSVSSYRWWIRKFEAPTPPQRHWICYNIHSKAGLLNSRNQLGICINQGSPQPWKIPLKAAGDSEAFLLSFAPFLPSATWHSLKEAYLFVVPPLGYKRKIELA